MTTIILMIFMLDHRQIQLFDTPESGAPTNIFAATFDREGNLYALDVAEKTVLVWDSQGSYLRRFGRPGGGPGEFNNPSQITVNGFVYVWDQNKIIVFQKTGTFVRQLRVAQIMPKRFIVLNQNELLIGFRQLKNGTVYASFEKRNRHNGVRGRTLQTMVNHGFQRTEYGQANATINAYMPDLDLQVTEHGTFIGFGGEPYLYHIDGAGDTVKKYTFDIPTRPPNAAEKERYRNLTFPVPGGHIAIKDLPQLVVRFDLAKAYWTQFTIKGGRVASAT